MTALAALWNFDGKPDAEQGCERVLAAQAIYGNRNTTYWSDGDIALGCRVHDALLDDGDDRQPVVAAQSPFVLIADARLDNRAALLAELGLMPGRSDAAVLLAAWERWREDCFDRLVGDYAFALWDRGARRLILARDPFGTRPLHYHRGNKFVAVASMPKGLHALPDIPRAPDLQRTAELLALLPEYGSRTFFRDIERVEQGHFAVVTPSAIIQQRHWRPERRTIRLANADDYAEGLLHHLDQAVRSCLHGVDGAAGAHLSAGYDSSAVATSAALQLAPSGGKVVAFTAVPRANYDGPVPARRLADEGPIAAKTAALHHNMEHVLIRTEGRSPLDDLDRNFQLFDRPVLNLCNVTWSNAILDRARERKLRVLLSGQAGNMSISFDGVTRLTELIRNGRLGAWLRECLAVTRKGNLRWRGALAQSFGPFLPDRAWKLLVAASGTQSRDVGSYSAIRGDVLKALDLAAVARERALDFSYRPRKDAFEARLWVLRRVDLGNYNKGFLAGWGIDYRDPTCDRRLVEFCLGVPAEQYFKDGVTRALARRALQGRVAPEVLSLKGKGLQAADWHEGLSRSRDRALEEVRRIEGCGPAAATIDVPALTKLLEDWPVSGWERESLVAPYRLKLLRGISVGHFLRRASGSNA